ncbi:MAG: ABC transporter ATP-binding protein [Thalassobaculales bacterium]
MSALLEIDGLVTVFPTPAGTVRAVDGVSLTVEAGQCLGVVGESGSGKSVTFASVMGLVRPPGRVEAGRILFAGRDLRALPEEAMRRLRGREIAMTMQDALTALNPALTVGTQLVETIRAHDPGADAARRAVALMEMVGIPAAAGRLADYPHQFSGGMRQRIMIAVALACRPKLLIADEPTTALDVTIQAQVLELIDRLRAELGMAVVLVTHDLGVVANHCDRVVVMYAGQVVEAGETAALLAAPRHPYTRGLLASIPRLDAPEAPIRPIPGQIVDPLALPAGCRFQPRCAEAGPECAVPVPLVGGVRCLKVRP